MIPPIYGINKTMSIEPDGNVLPEIPVANDSIGLLPVEANPQHEHDTIPSGCHTPVAQPLNNQGPFFQPRADTARGLIRSSHNSPKRDVTEHVRQILAGDTGHLNVGAAIAFISQLSRPDQHRAVEAIKSAILATAGNQNADQCAEMLWDFVYSSDPPIYPDLKALNADPQWERIFTMAVTYKDAQALKQRRLSLINIISKNWTKSALRSFLDHCERTNDDLLLRCLAELSNHTPRRPEIAKIVINLQIYCRLTGSILGGRRDIIILTQDVENIVQKLKTRGPAPSRLEEILPLTLAQRTEIGAAEDSQGFLVPLEWSQVPSSHSSAYRDVPKSQSNQPSLSAASASNTMGSQQGAPNAAMEETPSTGNKSPAPRHSQMRSGTEELGTPNASMRNAVPSDSIQDPKTGFQGEPRRPVQSATAPMESTEPDTDATKEPQVQHSPKRAAEIQTDISNAQEVETDARIQSMSNHVVAAPEVQAARQMCLHCRLQNKECDQKQPTCSQCLLLYPSSGSAVCEYSYDPARLDSQQATSAEGVQSAEQESLAQRAPAPSTNITGVDPDASALVAPLKRQNEKESELVWNAYRQNQIERLRSIVSYLLERDLALKPDISKEIMATRFFNPKYTRPLGYEAHGPSLAKSFFSKKMWSWTTEALDLMAVLMSEGIVTFIKPGTTKVIPSFAIKAITDQADMGRDGWESIFGDSPTFKMRTAPTKRKQRRRRTDRGAVRKRPKVSKKVPDVVVDASEASRDRARSSANESEQPATKKPRTEGNEKGPSLVGTVSASDESEMKLTGHNQESAIRIDSESEAEESDHSSYSDQEDSARVSAARFERFDFLETRAKNPKSDTDKNDLPAGPLSKAQEKSPEATTSAAHDAASEVVATSETLRRVADIVGPQIESLNSKIAGFESFAKIQSNEKIKEAVKATLETQLVPKRNELNKWQEAEEVIDSTDLLSPEDKKILSYMLLMNAEKLNTS